MLSVTDFQKDSNYYGNISYRYVFGDGATAENSERVTHSYTAPGVYTARVSLENLAGVISAVNYVYIQGKTSFARMLNFNVAAYHFIHR